MKIIPKYDDYELIGRVRTDASLAMANSDPLLIRRGLVDGASVVHKFGRNPSVANGTWEGILNLSNQFVWLTSASAVRIKSGGNTADTAAGAGAQSITVMGLDAAGNEVTETIATAGSSASSPTSTEFFRVYRAWVETTGTYTGTNTGNVTIETTGGTTVAQLLAGEGQTQLCAYTIPTGKIGLLASVSVQVDASKPADFRLMTRDGADTVTAPYQGKRLKYYWDGILGAYFVRPYTPILCMEALTDVWMEARGSGAGTECTADMEIILFDV